MTTAQYDYLFKFISVGDSGVGKSCLLLRFTRNTFQDTETTIGIEFASATVNLPRPVKLQIWDTAGQESFKSISRAYYRGSVGCLLCFDVSRRNTFENLQSWLDDVRGHADSSIILVANKTDLARQVSREEAQEYAKRHNLLYIETCSKTGENVAEAFTALSRHVFEMHRLDRDLHMFTDAEIKQLELKGIKVGPRRPALVLNPEQHVSQCC